MRLPRLGQDYGDRGFERAQSVLWTLIARLKESAPVDGETRRIENPVPAPAPSSLVQKVDAYLAAHVAEPFTLANLARELNISVSLLSHRYREEAGATAKERLMRLRMDIVKKLLIAGHPLKTAAASTGFVDPYYLSRAFSREEGLSPRAYLARIRKSEGTGLPSARQ
jgi:AraC family transcriptional activator of pobA